MQNLVSMCFKVKASSPLKKEHRCPSWEHRILDGWSSVEWGEEGEVSPCPALLAIPMLLSHYEVPDSMQKQVSSACVEGGFQKCQG